MNTTPAISLNNVSKRFRRKGRSDQTMLSRLAHPMRIRLPNDLTALHNISLDIEHGEVVGLVGANAAGKSTLLRIIAGILKPDSGSIALTSPVTSMLHLGAGMRHQLTVRDNIFLACCLYGMDRSQAKAVFDDIVSFGELEEYVDMFTYQLSTGYNQRLAFSIAAHSSPKILLLDEVFSAGDKDFQLKAAVKMRNLIRSDTTVVMVSHNMKRLNKFCNRVVWLKDGGIYKIGPAKEVTAAYQQEPIAQMR